MAFPRLPAGEVDETAWRHVRVVRVDGTCYLARFVLDDEREGDLDAVDEPKPEEAAAPARPGRRKVPAEGPVVEEAVEEGPVPATPRPAGPSLVQARLERASFGGEDMGGMDGLVTERIQMREPCLALPEFVTPEWVRREMALLKCYVRGATAGRKEIARISGFRGWPDRVPEAGEWERLVVEGMRYPFFLRAFYREAVFHGIPNPSKRHDYTAFRGLYTAVMGGPPARRGKKIMYHRYRGPQPPKEAPKAPRGGRTAEPPFAEIRAMLDKDPAKATEFAWVAAFVYTKFDHPALADLVAERRACFGASAESILEACQVLAAYPLDWSADVTGHGASASWIPEGKPEEADTAMGVETFDESCEGTGRDGEADGDEGKREEDGREVGPAVAEAVAAAALRPGPDVAPGALVEGMSEEDLARSWRRELQELIEAARAMEAGAPDGSDVETVAAKVAVLKHYADLWVVVRPPLADTGDLLRRLEIVLGRLSVLGKAEPAELEIGILVGEAPSCVPRAALAEAETVVGRAEAKTTLAEEVFQSGQGARRTIEDFDELGAVLTRIGARLKETRSAGYDAAREAATVLIDAAPSPPDVAPAPPVRPAPFSDAESVAGGTEAPKPKSPSSDGMAALGIRVEAPTAPAEVPEPEPAPRSAAEEPEVVEFDDPEEAAPTEAGPAGQAELDATAEAVRLERAAAEAAIAGAAALESAVPMAGDVARRLEELFAAGEFGAAYHLRRAAGMSMPDAGMPFTETELRLAATAGIGHGLSHVETQRQIAMFDEAATIAQEMTGSPAVHSDLRTARRIAMLASLIEPALFGGASHRTLVETIGTLVKSGVGNCFFDLARAVTRNRDEGFPLTVANLYAAAPSSDGRHAEEVRRHVVEKAKVIGSGRWDIKAATKVRNWLSSKAGPVGRLEAAMLRGDGLSEAREIVDLCLSYEKANNLISVGEEESGAAELYGDVRERFISNLGELASYCKAWVEAASPMDGLGHREKVVREIGGIIVAGSDRARRELAALAAERGAVVAAAVALADGVLARLKGIASGEETPKVEPVRHLVALHGPLLWIPGLLYAGGWTPSPYEPDAIIGAMLDDLPPALAERSTERSVRSAIEKRMREGSFIAARLLVCAGRWYGLPASFLREMADDIDGGMAVRRGALEQRVEEAKREVMRAQRFGPPGAESLDDLVQRLGEVDISRLPSDIDSMAPDTGAAERLLDFAAVERRVADVKDRVAALLAEPREVLGARLASIAAALPPERADELRRGIGKLLDMADLATAEEMLDHVEKDGSEAADGMIRPADFNEYFPAVPDALPEKGYTLDEVMAAIAERKDFRGLHFSSIEEPDEASKLLRHWRDFRQVVRGGGGNVAGVLAGATSMLTAFGLRCDLGNEMDAGRSNRRKAMFVGDITMRLGGEGSLMLPDFGSKTQSAWRLCVTERIPEVGVLLELCGDAGHVGVLLLVAGAVSSRQREEAALRLTAEGRRLLIVDETLFLYALSKRRFRPLTIIEVAQAFSAADPYEDSGNGAVPPEMFVGRADEIRKIVGLDSGFLVYGGRRLGKTALLRYVQSREHDPSNERVCVYVSLYETEAKSIWQLASAHMTDIFGPGREVHDGEMFCGRIEQWLAKNPKRRVLLLVDEANTFVSEDERKQFGTFRQLQGLMTRTGRRFKVVLAGLQNIARMVRNSENSPVSHVDRDVLRIGPLMGRDAADAERLVTRPLSGMGVTFENRDDVWRILSACNYYPVLIQLFCKNLVRTLRERARTERRIVRQVDAETVSKVLEDKSTLRDIKEAFDKTLKLDQGRYELLTYVVAQHVVERGSAGFSDEGLTAREVRRLAGSYWKETFGDGVVTDDDVAGLLDEMEGLGLLRKASDLSWTLRSRSILRFLGGADGVVDGLLSFSGRPAPKVFDPRVKRRFLEPTSKDRDSVRSPLTAGQEYDLLRSDGEPVRLVFGVPLAGLDRVAEALRTAPVGMGSNGPEIELARSRGVAEFVSEIKFLKATGERRKVLVVPPQCRWTAEWVQKAAAATSVREGRSHVVFIGGPSEASTWVSSDLRPRLAEMPVHTLLPWRIMMTETLLNQSQILDAAFRAAEIHATTGGWNGPICAVFPDDAPSKTRLEANLRKVRDRLATHEGLAAELGLSEALGAALRSLVAYLGADGRFTLADLAEELRGSDSPDPHRVLDYALCLGLVEAVAEKGRKGVDGRWQHELNALVLEALRRAKETVA